MRTHGRLRRGVLPELMRDVDADRARAADRQAEGDDLRGDRARPDAGAADAGLLDQAGVRQAAPGDAVGELPRARPQLVEAAASRLRSP